MVGGRTGGEIISGDVGIGVELVEEDHEIRCEGLILRFRLGRQL